MKADTDFGVTRQSTVAQVEARLQGLSYERENAAGHTVFRLAPAVGADYRFSVWVYDDGEPQITASLTLNDDKHFFWYAPFESPDWPTLKARADDFLAALDALISNRTRITQTRGILLWSFDCEFDDSGTWKSIGGVSCLRWSNFAVPDTDGRRRQYFSSALA